ncbi:MAG: DNA-directed RNA polymerase subunit alpha [Alphaproteobacteria bacterium]|nr:DNA-directed RNA polymerase subunit alpha [Alphaproteobacteria bacterium]
MSLLNRNWNTLIKPSKVLVSIDESKPNSAQIVVDPMERGWGHTLGNSIRRVLLSSLQGSAITSIRIPGVEHEFSSVPGVREDITDIVLNLKSVIIKMHSAESKIIRLKASGPCEVKVGMIETGSDVELLNKDHVICNLAKGSDLEIEFTCTTGRGYVPAMSIRDTEQPLGTINIDALYSPVLKVSYKVENTRVGQVTDYDKLIMNIETNGFVSPDLAFSLASRILQDQLQSFITFEEAKEESKEVLEELRFNPVLLKKVDELELSVRSQNCLKNDNIVYIGDLIIKTESEMLKTPNFGRKSLNEIKEILSSYNLKFGMEAPNWPPENLVELAKKYEDPY